MKLLFLILLSIFLHSGSYESECVLVFHEKVQFECNGVDHYFSYSSTCEVTEIEVKIYNRWGNEIKEISSPDFKWDGKWEGNHLPNGTYYYRGQLRFSAIEEQHFFDGKIEIIR